MRPENLPSLKSTIQNHNLLKDRAYAKKLGQHFLLDPSILNRIAISAGDLTACDVLEVGPGPGGLTRALLDARARRIIAIEKDPNCIHALNPLKESYQSRLELILGDALNTELWESSLTSPLKIVSNLPYNVATPLIIHFMKRPIMSMTVLIQKEVAERFVAPPSSKLYGRLSVLAQFLCNIKILFHLPPGAFTPPPKVWSSVIQFVPKKLFPEETKLISPLEQVTKAAFGQRRKMLRNTLSHLTIDWETLERLGIHPTKRAEELTVSDFLRMIKHLY